jgi:hypothetical protein
METSYKDKLIRSTPSTNVSVCESVKDVQQKDKLVVDVNNHIFARDLCSKLSNDNSVVKRDH